MFTIRLMENKFYFNPIHLPIVPPMDINADQADFSGISEFPVQLRIPDGTLFTIRSTANTLTDNRTIPGLTALIRAHEGTDLLAPQGTKIYAVADGIINASNPGSVSIAHTSGNVKWFTFYQHLQNVRLTVYSLDANGNILLDANGNPQIQTTIQGTDNAMAGTPVKQGELIGEVGPFDGPTHCHFEIRIIPSFVNTVRRNRSFTINAAQVLYHVEARIFWDNNSSNVNMVINTPIVKLAEVVLKRMRLIKINVDSDPNLDIYHPFDFDFESDELLVGIVKTAFFKAKRINISWRPSLFLSKLLSGGSSVGRNERINILREIRMID